ncbi:lytic murein transglycosylase B [Alcanivorax sp. JB21]|uniref:lytic murein transglycosylase B n=1 Tax=Alcanivorax limicola TaxID=2874102 RepID=UPI001CBDB4F7|nr:lytic murein transglycosylase B [Alcanivorax limicola]MBZ2189996.1 lytic murein transglycosylase B [Alcanivorax limicola]
MGILSKGLASKGLTSKGFTRSLLLAPLLVLGGLSAPAMAEDAKASNYANSAAGKALIRELADEGLDAERVRDVLATAERQEPILEAIARPAERVLTWGDYRKIFIRDTRIEQGLTFWQENRALLQRAEDKFGVPAEIIVAIIGVETSYGRNKGNWRVVDALATLGFDYPPRADFFRRELAHLFRLEQEAGIDAATVRGSYAGAMGMPQFISSSYRAYAVDFDGDGKIDLIDSVADAIGSVANYFKAHRWQTGLPVAARARVTEDRDATLFGTEYRLGELTLEHANQRGATALSCADGHRYCFDLPGDTRVAALELEGEQGQEFWLTTHNFYVITRYNHSHLYAMAVMQLSRELADRMPD